jgi:DNA-binding NarL/FixJ family response regulator
MRPGVRCDRRLSDVVRPAFERFEADDQTWLTGIATALEEHAGEGLGCVGSVYRPGAPVLTFDVVGHGLPNGLTPDAIFEATQHTAPAFVRYVYGEISCTTIPEISTDCEREYHRCVFDWGIRDTVCINARGPGLRGAAILLHRRRRRLGRGERAWFVELSALLEIAFRVRLEKKARAHPLAGLSSRERAVVLALGPDLLNKEIGAALGISASTVGVLLYRAAKKLGTRSRQQLLAVAERAHVHAGD